jgi:hypothetical protein
MAQTTQIVNENLEPIKSAALKSLSAATGTGAGAAQNWGAVRSNHALQVNLTGAPSAVNVNLEGSLDGVNWTTIGAWAIAGGQTTGQTVWFTGKAAIFTRANLSTLTGGTTPTVSAIIGAA